jgi:hypothetical protein
MSLLQTVLTDGDLGPRWRTWVKEMWRQKRHIRDLYDMKHWSERAVIALVMQSRDNSIQVYSRAGRFGRRVLSSRQGHGEPNPTWIPIANQAVRRMAEIMGGFPGGSIGEPFNMPLHRWLHHRRLPGDRCHRRLPARLRPPRPAHRRRLDDLGEPRGEPVADDHRAGRAGDGVLAQQG